MWNGRYGMIDLVIPELCCLTSIQDFRNDPYNKIQRCRFLLHMHNTYLLYWWSRRESNPHLKFRKLLFYPLNYGTLKNLILKFRKLPCLPSGRYSIPVRMVFSRADVELRDHSLPNHTSRSKCFFRCHKSKFSI